MIGRGAGRLVLACGLSACFSGHEPRAIEESVTCERAELPAGPDSAIVVIRGFRYEPAEITVTPGTRVIWVNCEPAGTAGHTTTADGGSWDSPTLVTGQSFSISAVQGVFEYHCRPHPGIRGRLAVQGGAATRQIPARLARR